MYKILNSVFIIYLFILSYSTVTVRGAITFGKYHNNSEVKQILNSLQQSNPSLIRLHQVAVSPGGEAITAIEIGSAREDAPALFVGANFEGNIPLATEGALALAKMVVDSSKYRSDLKWYILPLPNPDASKGYFSKVRYNRMVNDFPVNDDVDEAMNEDGFEDLNGDGLVTRMRVRDLAGTYLVSKTDPRLMVPADPRKNERGEYKIYSEGIDNDGDGQYNEDGEGGINVGISFPHLFPKNRKDAGLWPGQTPEVFGIMKFIYDRPNIAMVYTLGSTNFCLVPPKAGRKGDSNTESIKIPNRFVTMLGADPARSYTMDEVIDLLKTIVPAREEVTPSLVYSYFGLGGAVNPMEDDLKFYTRLSDEYKKYLKEKKSSPENQDPAPDKDGSFELWAYYQLGVPSFSMNLFSIPKIKEEQKSEKGAEPAEKTEKKATDETGDKERALLAWSDKELGGKGFVPWTKFDHPSLGEVEIGGFVPYLESTPDPGKIDSLLDAQLPWLLQLSARLPKISLAKEKVTPMGAGVYKLEIYLSNEGYLPYPTAMGERNRQPAPIIAVLDGDFDLLEGLRRTPVGRIGGNQVKKFTWLIKSEKTPLLKVKLESAVFGNTLKQIKIGE